MNLELPHDVVCACAKRDEPLIRASLAHGLLLMAKGLTLYSISHELSAISTAFSGFRPTSARHSVSSVYSVDNKISYYYCSFSCFFTKLFSMDFKLPHDILCRRAAHDNRRADGGLSDSSLIQITY